VCIRAQHRCSERPFFAKGARSLLSLDAHVGQHLWVKITPLTDDLITAGVVIYPSGKQDGGPGGSVFDNDLDESARYRIRVMPRQNPNAVGSFKVIVTLRTQGEK